MALPLGVTRIPRRSVTYTALDDFLLCNRYNNLAAGDIANQGNMWRNNQTIARRQAATMEAVQDLGDLMVQTVGYDRRSWINLTSSATGLGALRTSLRPNSVYVNSAAVSLTITNQRLFQIGDRVTMLKGATGTFDFTFSGGSVAVIGPSGAVATPKVQLATTVLGTSVTLELAYQDTTTQVWRIVAFNGAIGSTILLS